MDTLTILSGTRKVNPAESLELGARVLFAIEEEEAVIEATNHYNTCPGYFPAEGSLPIIPDDQCQFCLFGPINDMSTHLKQLVHMPREDRLGDPWFF
jgi:hypothetical protein